MQVQQTMCYETAITNWRRLKAAPDAHTMGVLYWQLNDIWSVGSLSALSTLPTALLSRGFQFMCS